MRSNFRYQYGQLKTPPSGAGPEWYRRRGRSFERVLIELLKDGDLEPRLQYRPLGEEIDGSFVLGSRVFLLEAKWHKESTPASSLYMFKGKVDGKLVGTVGIFISMSGYSTDAVDALTAGKNLNLILFDRDDIDICMEKSLGFQTVLFHKLRLAAEQGLVYAPSKGIRVTAKTINETLVWPKK